MSLNFTALTTNTAGSRQGLLVAFLLSALVLAFELTLFRHVPVPQQSNVVGIQYVVASEAFKSRPPPPIGPKEFCEAWTGQASSQVDCRTALSISSLQALKADTAANTLAQAQAQAQVHLTWMKTLRSEMEGQAKDRPIQTTLLAALNARIDAADRFNEPVLATHNSEPYQRMFQWLLVMDGVSYDSLRDQFRLKRWDIARLLDGAERLSERGQTQEKTLKRLPWLVLLSSALLLALGYWRAGWTGLLCIGIYLGITSLGLLLAADAATQYGQNSLYYGLNPLGNQLDRQLDVQLAGYLLLGLILLFKPWLPKLSSLVLQHHFASVWIVALLVVTAYALQSPAIGSETLKLGLALLAAGLMTDQGRVLHLIRKYAPDVFRPSLMWRAFRGNRSPNATATSATRQVLGHIAGPLLNFSAFGFAVLLLVSMVFKDLGGALIAALVLITTLFLVFGSRPALLSLTAMGLAGAVLSQTDKVQGRIQLMLEPMTASVSDFARLVAFSEASKPSGFGLGQIAWCNQEGTCLPLQVLSDYVPTLLNGLWGPLMARLLFVGICLYFAAMAGLACWRFLTDRGGQRLMAMVAFFLLLASLFQTVITFFGNWRLIPLTGLGAPLLSIGVSTMLAPTLAIALLLTCSGRSSDAS